MVGLLLLDKPQGISSFGAVAAIRRLTGEKRIGHTGTLDPMATGLLPILLGRATQLSSFSMDTEKEYEVVLRLGQTSDTLDVTGQVLSRRPPAKEADLLNILPRFTGQILQRPPMYSALKKDGVRLYQLAREGKNVERPARPVTIHTLRLLETCGPTDYRLLVRCSKGTYIRTLCDDIGAALGCGGVMASLRRTYTGGFSIDQSIGLERLEKERIAGHLLSADRAVSHFDAVFVSAAQARRFLNGGQLDLERLCLPNYEGEYYRIYGPGHIFLGMGKRDAHKGQMSIACLIQS